MPRLRPCLTAGIAALAVVATGCGTEKTVTQDDAAAASAPQSAAPAPTGQPDASGPSPSAGGSAPATAKISTDLSKEPVIPKPSGAPPAQLVSRDIVKGTGKTLKNGDQAEVRYVGIAYSTGQEFDASWNRGQDFPLTLGTGGVIPGWDQGLGGMRVGGRRELIIPPSLAYGAAGQPPAIQPNETLVFVVDLKSIG